MPPDSVAQALQSAEPESPQWVQPVEHSTGRRLLRRVLFLLVAAAGAWIVGLLLNTSSASAATAPSPPPPGVVAPAAPVAPVAPVPLGAAVSAAPTTVSAVPTAVSAVVSDVVSVVVPPVAAAPVAPVVHAALNAPPVVAVTSTVASVADQAVSTLEGVPVVGGSVSQLQLAVDQLLTPVEGVTGSAAAALGLDVHAAAATEQMLGLVVQTTPTQPLSHLAVEPLEMALPAAEAVAAIAPPTPSRPGTPAPQPPAAPATTAVPLPGLSAFVLPQLAICPPKQGRTVRVREFRVRTDAVEEPSFSPD